MKNVDNIILNSLRLINYDRSKHVTEQIAPPRPPMEKITIDPSMFKKYVPGKESSDTEKNYPYSTYKSVVTNKNIYLPLKKVIPEVEKDIKQDIFKDIFNKDSKQVNFKDIFDVSKRRDSLSGKVKGVKPITKNTNVVLKTISSSEPFNQEIAEKYFGSQCLKLSGKHPKYDVGYYKQVDYYVDGSGNQCTPIPHKVISQQAVKKPDKTTSTIETDVWQLDLPKPVKLKNGNTIQKSKYKYPKGCAPIEYNFCLRFSWENLHKIGSNDQGVLEFERGSSSLLKDQKSSLNTYVGCITDEWYPWFNTFIGYIDKKTIKESTDSSGVKQMTKCIRNGYQTTGVDVIENHLSTFNLESDIKTLYTVPFNNVLQFTLPEAIKESTGDDYEIKGKLVDYTVDLKQWFVFGENDYKTFKTDINTNFQDYINNSGKDKDEYEDFLKDFYGSGYVGNILSRNNRPEFRLGVGVEGLEEMINDEKTLSALTTKYEDIKTKFLDNNDFLGYLIKLSDDYNKEKIKPRPNKIVISYLENQWNYTLDIVRGSAYKIFQTTGMSIPSVVTLEEFTLLYLSKMFGVFDKNNKSVSNLMTSKFSTIINVETGDELYKQFMGKPTSVDGGISTWKTKGSSPIKTVSAIDPKIWAEISKFPLLIPTDYNQGGINTKNVKPVTIEDAISRGKSDGASNGFLYKSQSFDYSVGGNDKKIDINKYSYKNLTSGLSNQKIDETKVDLTEKDLQTQLDQFKAYEENIKNIISKTIVLIGK